MDIPEIEIGAFMLMLAGISGAILATLIKWGSYAFSIEFLMFIRWGTGLLALTIVLGIHKSALNLRTQRLGGHLVTAGCYLASMYCFYLALRIITVAEALLLLNTAPLFATIFSRLILKQKDPKSI